MKKTIILLLGIVLLLTVPAKAQTHGTYTAKSVPSVEAFWQHFSNPETIKRETGNTATAVTSLELGELALSAMGNNDPNDIRNRIKSIKIIALDDDYNETSYSKASADRERKIFMQHIAKLREGLQKDISSFDMKTLQNINTPEGTLTVIYRSARNKAEMSEIILIRTGDAYIVVDVAGRLTAQDAGFVTNIRKH